MANSFGKGRGGEGVVKEFEFEEYGCGEVAQVLFQELGTSGFSQLSRGLARH